MIIEELLVANNNTVTENIVGIEEVAAYRSGNGKQVTHMESLELILVQNTDAIT